MYADNRNVVGLSTSDEMSNGKIDKVILRRNRIQEYLKTHNYIMNADVRVLCGVSVATVNWILIGLVHEGKLSKCREGRNRVYDLNFNQESNLK